MDETRACVPCYTVQCTMMRRSLRNLSSADSKFYGTGGSAAQTPDCASITWELDSALGPLNALNLRHKTHLIIAESRLPVSNDTGLHKHHLSQPEPYLHPAHVLFISLASSRLVYVLTTPIIQIPRLQARWYICQDDRLARALPNHPPPYV